MDWTALIKAFILCLISLIIEAISATKSGKSWFEKLKRPKYSFSMKIWYLVGAVYYMIFGYIGYRLFASDTDIFTVPVILLILIMIFNGLGNFIIFKYHSLKWFYLVIYPFSLLLLIFIIVLIPVDILSAYLASIYFLWLIYDLYYGYKIWKLNS